MTHRPWDEQLDCILAQFEREIAALKQRIERLKAEKCATPYGTDPTWPGQGGGND